MPYVELSVRYRRKKYKISKIMLSIEKSSHCVLGLSPVCGSSRPSQGVRLGAVAFSRDQSRPTIQRPWFFRTISVLDEVYRVHPSVFRIEHH